jgi:tagatose-1,6-bisphosphate aldolase non-catalytic subunit AgaZ/GatZ
MAWTHEQLSSFINLNRATLLGVGPMSVNCVNAAIEISNQHPRIPILMVASRRQIDCNALGGGYVNNWTTESFSDFVTNENPSKNILLCRDHGGPWQNNSEVTNKLPLEKAMSSAKVSYSKDIESNFKILHIDPSEDIHTPLSRETIHDRVFELYEYCWHEATRQNKHVLFEIGTEQQKASQNTPEELEFDLNSIFKFCKKNNIPTPTFIVIQQGAKVMETRNVGDFENQNGSSLHHLSKMIETCNKWGVLMKGHNTDYLSLNALEQHPKIGIHAANVAPEFGVTETKTLLKILGESSLNELANKFLAISYESKKWEKWMLPDSATSDLDKAIISGHYIFSSHSGKELLSQAKTELFKKNINLDQCLKDAIKVIMYKYLFSFNLIN